jgi:hypothetical protein
MATATHEISIFIPLDESKSCIYLINNLNIIFLSYTYKYIQSTWSGDKEKQNKNS